MAKPRIIRRSRHHWLSQHHLPQANIIQKTHLCHKTKVRFLLAEKERFELSRRYSRPTPLAGAPLRPLEYFSVYSSRSAVCIRPATSILYTVFACLSSLFGKFFSLFGFCQPFFCMIFNCAIDILPFMRYNIIGLIDFTQRAPKYKKEE